MRFDYPRAADLGAHGRNRAPIGAGVTAACFAFYCAYALYFLNSVLSHTVLDTIFQVPVSVIDSLVQVIVLALLAFKFIFQRAKPGSWALAVVAILIFFISWRKSGEGWLFWLAVFVVCGQGVELKSLARLTLFLSVVTILFSITITSTGLAENYLSSRLGTQRYGMGFTNPNYFGCYLLLLCLSFSTLRFGKNPLPDICLLLITTFVNLSLTDSRSSALLSLVAIVALEVFYGVKSTKARKAITVAIVAASIILVGFSLYLMVFFDASVGWQHELDSLFSGRFHLMNSYYEMGPLTLFGKDYSGYAPIYWVRGKAVSFVVDNAYCHILLRYGIIPFIAFIAAYGILLYRLLKTNRWDALLFGTALMVVFGFSETLGVKVESNFFILAMAPLVVYWKKPDGASDSGASVSGYALGADR